MDRENFKINELNPIVDARLADGSRVSGVYKNIALNGPILTIRKFQDRYMSMSELIGNGTLSEEGALLLTALPGRLTASAAAVRGTPAVIGR